MFRYPRRHRQQELEKILALPTRRRARAISELVHAKQKGKAGEQYSEHPKRVAQNVYLLVSISGDTYSKDDRRIASEAAWLHDVLEESGSIGHPPVTIQDLQNWGIDEKVTEVIYLLSKKSKIPDGPAKASYYLSLKSNKVARLVKVADLIDKLNLEHTDNLAKNTINNKRQWESAIEVLELDQLENAFLRFRISSPLEIKNIYSFEQTCQKFARKHFYRWLADPVWFYSNEDWDSSMDRDKFLEALLKRISNTMEFTKSQFDNSMKLLDEVIGKLTHSADIALEPSPEWVHLLHQMMRANKSFEEVWQSTLIEIKNLPRAQEIWINWMSRRDSSEGNKS